MNWFQRNQTRLSVWIVLSGLLLTSPMLWAQGANDKLPERSGAVSNDETAVAEPSDDSIMSMIAESGFMGMFFMGVLGLFSLVGVAVAVERMVNVKQSTIIPDDFVNELKNLVGRQEDRPELFRGLCQKSTAPIANILKAALLRCGRPLPEVEKAMEDATLREVATLRSGVRPLSIVGSVAPLVGLLGTVVGMIIAFRTASQAGLGKAELLAQGIYMALITTAAGLTIAIPALLLAAFFNNRVDKLMREMDEHLMDTMPCFARMEQSPPQAKQQVEPFAKVGM